MLKKRQMPFGEESMVLQDIGTVIDLFVEENGPEGMITLLEEKLRYLKQSVSEKHSVLNKIE